MLNVVTLLWDANKHSKDFSTCYDETWVEKLYHGFKRNLSMPFQFVCYVDRIRDMPGNIRQILMTTDEPGYGNCIEPYKLNQPMILVGLDTIVTGNCDHFAEYCLTAETIALPRDPYARERACNGVALVPAGKQKVFADWRGENDMEWMRTFPHAFLDDIWPGQIVSYKGHVEKKGLGDARIVYFHGKRKPHELNLPWIREHWGTTSKSRLKTALVLGGAKTVWDDIEAALEIGEYDGVVACNDVGAEWKGRLDAWVSLHGDKLPEWNRKRMAKGYSAVPVFASHDERKDRPFEMGVKTAYRFEGQVRSGSSGLFAVKFALVDLGFDRAVCCGIPMAPDLAHFFDHNDWRGARAHRTGWSEAMHHLKDRVRSMSGWTMQQLGPPTPEWLAS